MEYITINYALNQTFHVHHKTFEQTIRKTIIKNYENIFLIDEPIINFIKDGQNLEIFLYVNIKKSPTTSDKIKNLASDIENSVSDLINFKPYNVKIIVNSIK